jgi:outer membrane protein assembly factor BamA
VAKKPYFCLYQTSRLKPHKSNIRILIKSFSLVVVIVVLLAGCNSTRFVPEDKYLLRKSTVHIIDKQAIEKDALEGYIKQKPNTRILGLFPFHLTVYNALNRGKERRFKNKLKKVIGEEPVIYDEFMTDKTVSQLEQFVKNKGFYHAVVMKEVRFLKQRAFVDYFVTGNEPYKIKEINYQIGDSLLNQFVLTDSSGNTLIKRNTLFDSEILEDERVRITKLLKNSGYYNFSKELINYLADSAHNSREVGLTLRIDSGILVQSSDSVIPHQRYRIDKVYVILDLKGEQLTDQTQELDTLHFEDGTFIFKGKESEIKGETLFSKIRLRPGSLFTLNDADKTYKNLSGLQQFRYINLNFAEQAATEDDSLRKLNCYIQLSQFTAQSYQIEFEATNSDNHWGLGGNLIYRHKNFYRGAEIFDVKLSGAFEFLRNTVLDEENNNSLPALFEYGIESKIRIPKFWLPFKLKAPRFDEKFQPKTNFSVNYNHQKRPFYTRTMVNAGYGYSWTSKEKYRHFLNPVELNVINLKDTTPEFTQYFDTLFLKHSYESQFISATSYTFQYSGQDYKKRIDFPFVIFRAEIAGNVLNTLNNLMDRQTSDEGYFELFGTRYAQYIKSDIDFRFYQHTGENSILVYRGFMGVGLPYGNSELLPFVKKYYSGGPNSIRAWQVRSIGPGSFVDNSTFPDLAADVKLEANLEYRFNIIWALEGAFFLDVGNIWAINKYDDRPGALFKLDSFAKELAIGTGFGARFDFEFILFRLDLGLKLRDPELESGNRWIHLNRGIASKDFAWNIGIGYPF